MRITQIMLGRGFGGAERLFVDLCLSLAETGQQIQAICHKGSRAAILLSQHPAITLETISVLATWDPFARRKIVALLQQNGTQVVQAHLARAAFIAGKACQKMSLPLVVTTHNYIDIKYYQHVTMLLPPTRDQYDYYQDRGFSADKMKIIRHFSPITAREKSMNSTPSSLRIVSLGRLVHKKGYHVLIEAFARLAKQFSMKCELFIGGTGPEQQALLAQIESLGLKNKVSLVGWVDDVAGFLQGGDLFVLPSLDEPFGIVVLEAMALGLPVVSSDCQGPNEILDENIAWISKKGEVDSLAVALHEACINHDERLRKSACALQRFRQTYSKEVVIPQFIALFDSLLTARSKPSPP